MDVKLKTTSTKEPKGSKILFCLIKDIALEPERQYKMFSLRFCVPLNMWFLDSFQAGQQILQTLLNCNTLTFPAGKPLERHKEYSSKRRDKHVYV
jgi:hypothetical protein